MLPIRSPFYSGLLAASVLMTGCSIAPRPAAVTSPVAETAAEPEGLFAEITTPRGVITCELFYQKVPLTVANFIALAEGTIGPEPGRPLYDGTTFHLVEPGHVIQGGDPTGTGSGGPYHSIPSEFFVGGRHDRAGVLSMARPSVQGHGSQFFITLAPVRHLDYVHPIFGRVVAGGDVPEKIVRGDAMTVKIIRRGPDALAFRTGEDALREYWSRTKPYPARMVEDDSGVVSYEIPILTDYLTYRLTNLALHTNRHFYVRIYDTFIPEHAEQTAEEFIWAEFDRLHLRSDAILIHYYTEDRLFYTYAGPTAPKVSLPDIQPRSRSGAALLTLADIKGELVGDIYDAISQVISAFTDQTDPK